MVVLEIVVTVLLADLVSGLFHWLEDAYGREEWPITGWLITKPNILHHHDPRYFTRHNWLHSSWLLVCLGLLVLLAASLFGCLTWHVWVFVVLGANANQIHKWAHRSAVENGPVITLLQRVRLLQTPRHHAQHHTNPKNSHYCVLTDFLNPILDTIRLWDTFEVLIWALFRVRRRVDTSVVGANERARSRSAADTKNIRVVGSDTRLSPRRFAGRIWPRADSSAEELRS